MTISLRRATTCVTLCSSRSRSSARAAAPRRPRQCVTNDASCLGRRRARSRNRAGGRRSAHGSAVAKQTRLLMDSLRGTRVLVVDDDPDNCEMLAAVLEHSGALVCTAGSSAEALVALEKEGPQVLLKGI